MRRARVYRRGPRLFLHAVSRTADDRWVMAAPIAFPRIDDAETFLGETLLSALAASRSGARDPGDAIKRQLLDTSRSRTWTTFMRGTTVVDVEQDDQAIRLFPARNATRRPFVPSEAPASTLPRNAPTIELGWAVKTLLRSLEPKRRPRTKSAA
jgi:hypothetical protein